MRQNLIEWEAAYFVCIAHYMLQGKSLKKKIIYHSYSKGDIELINIKITRIQKITV